MENLAIFNNIKNIRDKIANGESIQDINNKINEYDELKNIRDNINSSIDNQANKEKEKRMAEKDFYNSLSPEEKIEYNRRKKRNQNIKRLGMYGAGIATAGLGIGIPILMAAGTWNILNDDAMTSTFTRDLDHDGLTDTHAVMGEDAYGNNVTYGTFDFDEDDYSETAFYMVEDGDGNVAVTTVSDFDEDGYVDADGYIEINEDGSEFVFEEYDFNEDGTSDLELVGYSDEYGNVDLVAGYDSNYDGVDDLVYEAHYDSDGNLISEDYYEDVDGDGLFDLHF